MGGLGSAEAKEEEDLPLQVVRGLFKGKEHMVERFSIFVVGAAMATKLPGMRWNRVARMLELRAGDWDQWGQRK